LLGGFGISPFSRGHQLKKDKTRREDKKTLLFNVVLAMRIGLAVLSSCLLLLTSAAAVPRIRHHALTVRGGASVRARPKLLSLKRGRVARFRLAFVAFWKSLFDPFYGMDSKKLPSTAGQGIVFESSGSQGGGDGRQTSSFTRTKVKGLTVNTLSSSAGCSTGG